MSLYQLKSSFQRLLQPCCRYLHKQGVKPNSVTISAVFLSALGGLLVYFSQYNLGYLWLVPVLLLIRIVLNALDGMLAHQYNQTSKLGKILNEMGDVVADALFYLPFAYVLSEPKVTMLVSLVVLGIFAEMLGVLAQTIGADRRYDGPLGKSDRAALFGLLAIVLALGFSESIICLLLLLCGLILSLLTLKNRLQHALTEAN